MASAPVLLKNTKGIQFFKFLGTGGGQGFSLKPDFSTYAFLGVWDNFSAYNNCINSHPVFVEYQKNWVAALYQKQYDKWEIDNDSIFIDFQDDDEEPDGKYHFAPMGMYVQRDPFDPPRGDS